jgi:hypothetical protein
MMVMSLNVPGSPSSAFTTRYIGLPATGLQKPHFTPAGKPAPPRPRMFAAFISVLICARSIDPITRLATAHAPVCSATSSFHASATP